MIPRIKKSNREGKRPARLGKKLLIKASAQIMEKRIGNLGRLFR